MSDDVTPVTPITGTRRKRGDPKLTPEQRREIRAETARNMNAEQRRGLNLSLSTVRQIVLTFDSPETAQMFDAMDEEQAYYWLWSVASEKKAMERG